MALLHQYGKVAWRYLTRHPAVAILNFAGLWIGTTASLLIFAYVAYESHFDTFQPQYERTYRVATRHYQEGVLERETAFTIPALGPTVVEQIPEVSDYFRVTSWAQSYTLTYHPQEADPVMYKERQAYFADAMIISYWGLSFLQGNPGQALTEPTEIILSASTATRYFGPDWPKQELLGRTLEYHDTYHGSLTFTVAGVFEDCPARSHLPFDMLFSHRSLPLFLPEEIPPKQRTEMFDVSWGPPTWYTYVVLDDQAVVSQVEQRITEVVEERNADPERREALVLQPIRDIYLHSDVQDEPRATGSATRIYFLTAIAILILLIAWSNYMNLTVVSTLGRAKEVGVRKLFYATRAQVVRQFVFEAGVLHLFVLLSAGAGALLFLPWLSDYLNLSAQLSWEVVLPGGWLLVLLGIGTLATGLYPAWLLSGLLPLTALRNKISVRNDRVFRSALVVFQLGGAVLLMVVTFAAVRQVHYLKEQGAGVDLERILVIEAPNVLDPEVPFFQRVETFREALQPYAAIQYITAADFIPGSPQYWNIQAARIETPNDLKNFKQINVEQQYLPSIEAVFLAGENFSRYAHLEGKLILNRMAAQWLGYPEPRDAIHQRVTISHGGWSPEMEIIGVVENYHQRSLEHAFDPILFFPDLSNGNMLVKLSAHPTGVANTMELIRTAWEQVFPGNPFDYFFLQDFYQRQYQAEVQFSRAFRLGTVVALIIAFVGLTALISFATLKKQKEVGIRKVLGASVYRIWFLLTKRLLGLLFLACVLATPLAYWLVRQWLEKYAFRVDLSGSLFIIPILAILVLVLLTLSFHTFRAARMNPVTVLRDE